MLRELADVRQILDEPERRWFADDYFDLIVWFDKKRQLIGFQLCYDLAGDERALTWRTGTGFSHQRVDDGERQRPYKATPILVADGAFDAAAVAPAFVERSREMDQQVARFVLAKIEGFSPDPEIK